MKKVCVIGANGFVGSTICKEIETRKNLQLIKITRQSNMKKLIEQSDIVIHSANNSKRYFANQNRSIDLFDTMEKMLKILKYSNSKKIILISTISARVQKDTPYGAHRRACELLLNHKKDLIIRMGNMFGENNKKGALFDILQNKDVYANKETRCAFVDVKYNAFKVVDLLEECVGIIELGAKNHIKLGEIAKRVGSKSRFLGSLDTQLPENVPSDAPDVSAVFNFVKNQTKLGKNK